MAPDPYAHLLDDCGQIRKDLIDDLLIEVVSGRSVFISDGEMYAVRAPLMSEQDTARIVYARRLHKVQQGGVPTRSEIEKHALEVGWFDEDERRQASELEALMQRLNKAREMSRSPQDKVNKAAEMEQLRKKVIEIRMREEEVFLHSAESRAEDARIDYLISVCTLGGELLEKPVWSNWDEFRDSTNLSLIGEARRAFMRVSGGLPIKIIRAIARSHEWKQRWRSAREAMVPVFGGNASDWDANKRNLAWWSDFYDNIAKHPESPPEATVNDDDALQDWLNQQVAKQEAAKRNVPGPNGKRPPVYRDGRGNLKQMTRVGSETHRVNTPFAIKT